ncbi:YeeE/YedE family protein [Chitinophaga sedimenti]|uniref:YeeE/YedE family protein n=1 Tax=Chitinophaga sedimenti TaxID=2033606 RepID=UPI0027DFCE2A|nr:hypothetical protein [Chitinophaga sedimenti]
MIISLQTKNVLNASGITTTLALVCRRGLIGLIVPALLILGNKHFGISANLRHACAACFPAGIKFFQYDWKKEIWNFFFVGGILAGALLTVLLIPNPNPVAVNPALAQELARYGITDRSSLLPKELFSGIACLPCAG